jgi:hypothetical protein
MCNPFVEIVPLSNTLRRCLFDATVFNFFTSSVKIPLEEIFAAKCMSLSLLFTKCTSLFLKNCDSSVGTARLN